MVHEILKCHSLILFLIISDVSHFYESTAQDEALDVIVLQRPFELVSCIVMQNEDLRQLLWHTHDPITNLFHVPFAINSSNIDVFRLYLICLLLLTRLVLFMMVPQ